MDIQYAISELEDARHLLRIAKQKVLRIKQGLRSFDNDFLSDAWQSADSADSFIIISQDELAEIEKSKHECT